MAIATRRTCMASVSPTALARGRWDCSGLLVPSFGGLQGPVAMAPDPVKEVVSREALNWGSEGHAGHVEAFKDRCCTATSRMPVSF